MISRKQKLGIVENGEGKQKEIPISNRAKGLEQIIWSSLGTEGPFTMTVIYYWMKKVAFWAITAKR